jgi:DNA processing protein
MDVTDERLSFGEERSLRSMGEKELARWIALSRIKGLGCVSFRKLADHFDDPIEAFSVSAAALAEVEGFDQNAIDGVRNFAAWDEVEKEIVRAKQAAVKIVPFTDPSYPARLRMIPDPPPVLYVKGEIRDEDERAVAVVGSRSASDYGRRITRNLCRELVALGFTIVSGMARGIDGAAHEMTLSAGGRTIAVLGSGVDYAYPPEHEHLYQRISQSGAVVSEFPIGTRPMAFNFPARNRVISGLSAGVVVVEATEKSGSLITARLAVEQGREVFAVPGEVGTSRSRGAHRLIRQGAKLVESAHDIIEEIAPQLLRRGGEALSESRRTLPQNVSGDLQKIFSLFQERSLQIDEIIETSGYSPAKVSQVLLELELHGYIKQLPGKKYTTER